MYVLNLIRWLFEYVFSTSDQTSPSARRRASHLNPDQRLQVGQDSNAEFNIVLSYLIECRISPSIILGLPFEELWTSSMSPIAKLRVHSNLDVLLQKNKNMSSSKPPTSQADELEQNVRDIGKHGRCRPLSLCLIFLSDALVKMQLAMLFVIEVTKGTLPETNHRFHETIP